MISRHLDFPPHLYHLWCIRVQVGTSSCTARCRGVGTAHTGTPSLDPRCSSTRTWSRCSCWLMTAGTLSTEPLCSRSLSCCLKEKKARSIHNWTYLGFFGREEGVQAGSLPAGSSYRYIQFQLSSAQSRRCTRSGSSPPC